MWIGSARFDSLFIIGPAFLSTLIVILLNSFKIMPTTVEPLHWLILVVFIDVAHVWSTLYRTYLDDLGTKTFSTHLWLIPLACYMIGVFLHSFGELFFWRVLAYMAVFHFVRQQYGFFMIYKSKEHSDSRFETFDKISIYAMTMIPLSIWHIRGQQTFDWFLKGDFFYYPLPQAEKLLMALGILLFLIYFMKEIFILKNKIYSGKNLIFIGTALAWWTGIVFIPTDWSFTVTNVVSHGVPYFALIYFYHLKDRENLSMGKRAPLFVFFLILFMIGYIEEGLWDSLFWNDHKSLFKVFSFFRPVENLSLKSLLVPLLALPQATHYVLDGYIWKRANI